MHQAIAFAEELGSGTQHVSCLLERQTHLGARIFHFRVYGKPTPNGRIVPAEEPPGMAGEGKTRQIPNYSHFKWENDAEIGSLATASRTTCISGHFSLAQYALPGTQTWPWQSPSYHRLSLDGPRRSPTPASAMVNRAIAQRLVAIAFYALVVVPRYCCRKRFIRFNVQTRSLSKCDTGAL